MKELQPFSLTAAGSDKNISYPGERPAVVLFVKEDCPTCREILPLIDQLQRHLAPAADLHVLGQTEAGNEILAERVSGVLDDSGLKVAFAHDVDTVPSLLFEGAEPLIGFVKSEWQAFTETVCAELGLGEAEIDWAEFPEWRPGCGSLSADPTNAARLQAESENSPLRARRIEVGGLDDEFEFMFDQGFSDGLPLVPPTPERVLRMLSGTTLDPQEVISVVPPNMGEATVEKVAINAVMAGCKPEYLPVVLASLKAVCSDRYNIHGVMATTMGASPVLVVNGPVRERIGMNMTLGALGQGNRANATIGRALRLAVRNIGGAHPGGTERSTLGNPMKFTMCFAEWEERNPWGPLHVERGFDAQESVVSIYTATSGPVLMVDQTSRSGSQLAGSFGLSLESIFGPKQHMASDTLVVVCPEHVDTFMRDGYTKADIRRRIQEVTARPISELLEDEISGTGFKPSFAEGKSAEELAHKLPKFRTEEDIHIVVAGAEAGKFSGAFHGWATGEIGSITVSEAIDPFF